MMKVIKGANLLIQSIIRYFNVFETVLRQKGKNLKSCPWEVTDNLKNSGDWEAKESYPRREKPPDPGYAVGELWKPR